MQIDTSVEPLVREAFAAVLAEDDERAARAMRAIADAGDEGAEKALTLAVAVGGQALLEQGGARPDDEQLDELASSFVQMNPGVKISREDALAYLTALANQQPDQAGLSAEKVTWAAYGVGVWLLAAFGPPERRWYEYLDQILDALEAAQQTT